MWATRIAKWWKVGYCGAEWEMELVLLGESVQKLDAKNRVTLPAKLRPHFAEGVVVATGVDRCLSVYTPQGFERFVDAQLGSLSPFSREARLMRRHLYAGAGESELDRQGRVMLAPSQLAHAGLQRDIAVVGLRDMLEIWDLASWRTTQAEAEGSIEDVAESLSQQ
jgi:MraZ protein